LEIVGLAIGFSVAVLLIFKKYNMGLSLFIGATILSFFSGFGIKDMFQHIIMTLKDPTAVQLMLVVSLISGLGYLMDLTGDMRRMIESCIAIFKDGRILSMLLPALIGTLSAPGGAILSAPMVNESGDKIGINQNHKTAVNLFFRHIGYFVYPLFSSIIIASSILEKSAFSIIKYNIFIMLVGLIVAYFIFFRKSKNNNNNQEKRNILKNLKIFFKSFLPIFVALVLALGLKVYFPLAILIGVITAIFNDRPENNKTSIYRNRIKKFFKVGIKYNLVLIILGVMFFKTVLENSGVINILAEGLASFGLPLILVVIVLGFISGYVTGVHMAATGILLAIFVPLFPAGVEGPYISLLFTSIILGYLVSPLHLCLALTADYFSADLKKVYGLLFFPISAMIAAGITQVIFFS